MKHGTSYQLLKTALVAAGLALAAPAWAAGYCSAGMATEGIAAANVTFEGASANDCYGVLTGNINGNDGAAFLNGLNWGTGWTYLVDATDAASAPFMGLQLSVSATSCATGSWTLTGIETKGGTAFPASLVLRSA